MRHSRSYRVISEFHLCIFAVSLFHVSLPGKTEKSAKPITSRLCGYKKDHATDCLNKQFALRGVFQIGCLTERNNSLLMWAHYGASYRGVCIEYDFSNFSAIESRCMFAPVMYSNSCPEVPESVIAKSYKGQGIPTEDQNQLSKGLFTKSPDWKYEYEWRIVKYCSKDKRISKYLPFEMPPIRKIYLGAEWRAPFDGADWIYHDLCEICEPRGIDIIETHLNAKSYTVDIL